ncbi:Electrogenic sodium bicarbonate cotransporter 1 [Durusdinium trenchii]|uniref:Electrogenic sodium bicarbonate cotransporter 1 n=2 Tax=Durusdinium trenchii TaxID=1381693 RepID=A0ABP0M361_9DINO
MEHERLRQLRYGGDLREAGFLWQLARELGTAPVFQWLQERTAFPDAVRLAFSFLDVDRDGMLSASDLLAHVAGLPQRNSSAPAAVAKMTPVPSSNELVKIWIERWQVKDRSGESLTLQSFREALLSSCSGEDALFGTLDDAGDDGFIADTEMEGPEHAVGVVPHRGTELQRWGGDGGTGGSAGRPLSFTHGGDSKLAAMGGI